MARVGFGGAVAWESDLAPPASWPGQLVERVAKPKGGDAECSAVIPQLGGADGDAVTIIEGAGSDALEIGLNRIETVINL
jgi:hypothetical protein